MSCPIRLGVVMDPIEAIAFKKDSTLAMLLAAQARGWQLQYMLRHDLYTLDGEACATMRALRVENNPEHWYELGAESDRPLTDLDVILMRVDPPYNMEYIYSTYVLQRAQEAGVLVVNRPDSLRLINEKLYISWFADLCPPTLVTSQRRRLKAFLAEHGDIIIKPLDGMGGASVFRVRQGDPNTSVILETMTGDGTTAMAQRYLPEIATGDKRALLIDGEPLPYTLARVPAEGELRGNLAAGGLGEGRELTARDRQICSRVGPVLRDMGISFAGLDIIGDSLTEINVTSPTCVRELDAIYGLDIGGQLMDFIAGELDRHAARR